MFTAKIDDRLLFTPLKDTYRLYQPKIILEANKASSFDFTIYPDHPEYKNILKFNPIIKAYDDDKLIFRGRVIDDVKGWENEKDISCEGEMSFFNDSIVRPYDFKGSVSDYLKFLVKQHNGQVDNRLQFTVRNVTVVDPNDLIVRANSNYPNTLQEINDKLFGLLGGYFYLEHDEDKNITFLDYYEDPPFKVDQGIEQGKNLLDLTETIKGEDIATAIIPLGAKIEAEDGSDTGKRLTIATANNGKDYLCDEKQVQAFGYLYRTVIWDDVTTVDALMRNAKRELAKLIKPTYTLELKAFDLSLIDVSLDKFDVLHYVKATSKDHALAEDFLITKLTIDMENPENGTVTIGQTFSGISDSTNAAHADIINTQLTAQDAVNKAIYAIESADSKSKNWYGNKGDGFPPNPNVGDLYFETDGDKKTIYQWDGTSWVVQNDTAWQEDFEQEMQDKLDQAKEENDAALADLDKQLSDAQTAIDNVEAANDAVVKAVDQAQQDIKTVDDAAAKALAEAMTGQGMATIVQNDLNNTKTVVSQLSDSITLAVQKNDVINQINVSTEGILIAGEKVHITGTTLIDDAIITTAMIKELDASVITTGTLAANLIVPTAGNMLMNSEFQSNTFFDGWISGGSITGTDFYDSAATFTDEYGGNSTMAGINTINLEVTTSNFRTKFQDVRGKDGVAYSASMIVRMDNNAMDSAGGIGRAGLNLSFIDKDGKSITGTTVFIDASALKKPTLVINDNKIAPTGTKYVRVTLVASGKVNAYYTRIMLNRGAKALPYTASTGQVIVGSDMIVDGAIIAKHLSAESVTAEKLAVGAVNMGSAVVTGTLDANRINVINLDASQIKVGTLNAATVRIINLDASAITTGTLNVAVQINANSIVSGSLNAKLLTGDTAHLNSVDTGVITNRIDDHLQLGAYNATENVGQINITSRTATNVDYPGGTTIYSNPYDSGERWGIRLYRNRIMPLNRSQDAALELNPYTKGAVNVRNRDQDTWLPVNASKFNVISERKFKNKIQVFKDSALEIINDTTIYSYEKSGRKEIGVISDEANGALLSKGQDGERFVDLYSYSSIAIKAIQELTDEVDSLKSQIEEMEKKIA
ncbi:phage tail spike protein [Lactococcus formosensis]|uniref:phage tail spike protein n=1 Tax=Lactococcus formosensis TaxID=1281486 RepID=UPI003263BC6C